MDVDRRGRGKDQGDHAKQQRGDYHSRRRHSKPHNFVTQIHQKRDERDRQLETASVGSKGSMGKTADSGSKDMVQPAITIPITHNVI